MTLKRASRLFSSSKKKVDSANSPANAPSESDKKKRRSDSKRIFGSLIEFTKKLCKRASSDQVPLRSYLSCSCYKGKKPRDEASTLSSSLGLNQINTRSHSHQATLGSCFSFRDDTARPVNRNTRQDSGISPSDCGTPESPKELESPHFQALLQMTNAPRRIFSGDNKSFSHELNAEGVRPFPLSKLHRSKSWEEVFNLIKANFNKAKEEVNIELKIFTEYLIRISKDNAESLHELNVIIGDLLILTLKCIKVTTGEFWNQCERIVQELNDKWRELPQGVPKQLHTHLLYILIRCTRLLQFRKESWGQKEEFMLALAYIARQAANAISDDDQSMKTCLHNLRLTIDQRKFDALTVETFGIRIEKLIREKYSQLNEIVDDEKVDLSSTEIDEDVVLKDDVERSLRTRSVRLRDRISIDDFEEIKEISRGAFGRVVLAKKRTTGDIFAIKVLKKTDMIRKDAVKSIIAERNILIKIQNPLVVRFYYSFTSRENLYLVMEYVKGGDFYSLLKNLNCIHETNARKYIAEVVLALEYLHSEGVVHRDLKPDNILVADDGHVKLIDFGLSKVGLIDSTGDLSGPKLPTSEHKIKRQDKRSARGTPDYLAPEILRGTGHGATADWWSVGIILFEFIVGIPPFNADNPEKIFDNILKRDIPWPSDPEEMTIEARDLINRLLAEDPHQRLGARGAAEVKQHIFFKGINWDTLPEQKVEFVPHTEDALDTSYFLSRYPSDKRSSPTNDNENGKSCESSRGSNDHNYVVLFDDPLPIPPRNIGVNFYRRVMSLNGINIDEPQSAGQYQLSFGVQRLETWNINNFVSKTTNNLMLLMIFRTCPDVTKSQRALAQDTNGSLNSSHKTTEKEKQKSEKRRTGCAKEVRQTVLCNRFNTLLSVESG
ncbi:unnamed protein product [Eruca vesicaria subsp. sativa]|uniref:non-specific serine/threonine protein kinase n=1 Tax=Eruca vesicaria subsp. sativa TaxID=29727 RepID=A0ABC8JCD7_ERUVS|nr:unnamed protein product [Eruca vesicaria subsp. sativa]